MNRQKYTAALLLAAAFSVANAEPQEASFQDQCALVGLMAQTAMGERLSGTGIGQTVEKMNERFMVVAKNDYSRSFIQGLTERVAQEIYHFPQSALNAVPKSDYAIFARDTGKPEYQLCMKALTGKTELSRSSEKDETPFFRRPFFTKIRNPTPSNMR